MTLPESASTHGDFSLDGGAEWKVEASALEFIPRAFAQANGVLPLTRSTQRLGVALADTTNFEPLDALANLTGLAVVSSHQVESRKILAAIDACYGRMDSAPSAEPGDENAVFPEEESGGVSDEESRHAQASDAPIIGLVHQIIQVAMDRRASDIHVEPAKNRLRVRYRVDGVLLEDANAPKSLQLAMVSRIKIMADISIAEKRVPQDGRMQVKTSQDVVDLRVSVIPSVHGESVVMRILNRRSLRPDLAELGFMADDQKSIERLMALPDGIVLVTGPTGSGKTTTLYSCLHQLNRSDRKLITVEDPVEYQLSGVNQVPVRKEIGLTFASALRAILRQAPNIVMVGEIRDGETAEIALQAAMTGHLVFSTLHTNDAVGAVARLIDLGAKPYLVASAVRAVLAQRLVRKNCLSCARPYQPDARELKSIGLEASALEGARFLKGTGCIACGGTGYLGRLAICELLEVNDEICAMIHAGTSSSALRTRALAQGLRSLRQDGVRKVKAGLTTIEEVVSITVDGAE